jgi:hypothetical protein
MYNDDDELECNLCGLVYVGETKGKQSILSMRVRIIEQIYHRTNKPLLIFASPMRHSDISSQKSDQSKQHKNYLKKFNIN